MAHPVLSFLTLLGASCQLQLAWRGQSKRREADYSVALEGLAALSLEIEQLIGQLAAAGYDPTDMGELRRSKELVDRATALLLQDLRRRKLG